MPPTLTCQAQIAHSPDNVLAPLLSPDPFTSSDRQPRSPLGERYGSARVPIGDGAFLQANFFNGIRQSAMRIAEIVQPEGGPS